MLIFIFILMIVGFALSTVLRLFFEVVWLAGCLFTASFLILIGFIIATVIH